MPQRFGKEVGVLATVEPEAHFVEVGRQVFGANFMPGSDDATLQE